MVTWAILMAMAMAGEGAGREGGRSQKGAPQQLCQARSVACGTEKGGILNRLLNMRLAITYLRTKDTVLSSSRKYSKSV